MLKDPYGEMVIMMKRFGAAYNPPTIQIGEVSSEDPLVIKIGDLEIDKNNLLVADYLLAEHSRTVKLDVLQCEGYKDCLSRQPDNFVSQVQPGTPGTASTPTVVTMVPSDKEEKEIIAESTLIFTDTLKVGDLVAIMPTSELSKFIVLSRVKKL
ncbi:DUF2577 domain-containing protein [Oceanirhabdus sp. W0125-5]|uniref:DUF2577 domain-containing protein n=1 Tax=Oceanirhabdus sp. W0125-5 TaxID=2999116 RepID=UPI0022F3385E|nr:DUF2577 domain-containing protein [Oceanirhabdus sp. W0125-5]WBW96045.1 DUF2577 domain-containing protein [Oceanirhabdus sp. W0125-5]